MQAAETNGPQARNSPVRCAPGEAPCRGLGKPGRRKATHHRLVRSIANEAVVFLDVAHGEHQARSCRPRTVRVTPAGVEPGALQGLTVREAVIGHVLDDGVSVGRVITSMGRDFLLELTDGLACD